MQLVTAAQRPPGLKAIFPIVPMSDSYRDITFSGGQVNVSFIPLWLGLVTGLGLVPPAYALSGDPGDLVRGATTLASHAAGAVSFQAATVLSGASGGSVAFDGPFHRTRSPIELLDRIDVPAFVVGGHHDLFQRGEPLVYERLKRNVDTRLLMGPWTHLNGSRGDGLEEAGLPSLDQIALRWFDRLLKGIDTDLERIPKVTQWSYGAERYETQADWPNPHLRPTRRYLREGSLLSDRPPAGAEQPDSFVQHPLSGVCTQSTSQWSAGLTEELPCTQDNRLNEALGAGAVYTTPPMTEDLELSGPILANLWLSTTARDAVVSVRVTDVSPDGASRELSGGWLAGSFRAVDPRRARVVHGELLQPWHPFTHETVLPVEPGKPILLPVEVFPVNGVIREGHRLRITVNPSDFPHAVPPLPQLTGSLAGVVSVLHDAEHPSYVALPTLGDCIRATRRDRRAGRAVGRCRMLRTPRLTRE
jgi:putative CocE/NonD family hydrolase